MEQGRTERWVAKKACISSATIYAYISGVRTPNLDNALKIAKVLNLPVEQLFEIKIQ